MGVLGVWYNNFFGAQSHALLPYDQVGTLQRIVLYDLNVLMIMTQHSFLYPSTCTGLLLFPTGTESCKNKTSVGRQCSLSL